MRKLTINVTDQVAERLEEMAKRRGIPVTELIRRSVATQSLIDKAFEEYGDLMVVQQSTKAPVALLDASMT